MSYLNSINSYESTYNSTSRYAQYTSDDNKIKANENNTENVAESASSTTKTASETAASDKIQSTLDKINANQQNAEKLFSALNSMQNFNYFSSSNNSFNVNNNPFNNLLSLNRDFSMMRSGSYYSILKNYYNNQNSDSSSLSSAIDSITSATSASQNDKTNSTSEKLQSTTLFELKDTTSSIKTNENSIKLELNSAITAKNLNKIENNDDKSYMNDLVNSIQNFADSYNSMIDKGSETDSTNILNNVLSLTKMTRYNATSLEDIGITLGNDNKLTVDKDTLKNADLDKINSMFGLNGSFGDYVMDKADHINSLCRDEIKSTLYSERYNSISQYL